MRCFATLGFAFVLHGCVVRETTPMPGGYGYGYGPNPSYQPQVSMGTPTSDYVSSMPPEPLYEQMTASPGYGYAWIDGYWHWNGYEWVWVGGRWDRQQDGYVYVQPYYDNVGGSYIYTPGYWAPHDHLPRGWQVRPSRDGRPSVVAPPAGWHTPPQSVGGRRPVAGPTVQPINPNSGTREPIGGGERGGARPLPNTNYDPPPSRAPIEHSVEHSDERPPERPSERPGDRAPVAPSGTYQPPPPPREPPRPARNYEPPPPPPAVTHPAPPARPVEHPAHPTTEHH